MAAAMVSMLFGWNGSMIPIVKAAMIRPSHQVDDWPGAFN
jgi:hypothetical protein